MIEAIVYTSNTGHTKQYAELISKKLRLPVYELNDSQNHLNKSANIIYLGWLCAASVKGYKKAAARYDIKAVCGVGLCDTGCLLNEVRHAIRLPESVPLFTLQGGIQRTKLRGINALMISTLVKVFASKKQPTADDKRMLELLTHDANYVSEDNLTDVFAWYNTVN